MRRVTVVYNVSAGRQGKSDISYEIRKHFESEWCVRLVKVTAEDLQRRRITELFNDSPDLAIAVGGDGTVMACASALYGRPVPLVIIPYGTGNIIARNLGIPLSIEKALNLSVRGARRTIDLGQTEAGHFVMAAGIGVQADFFAHASTRVKARMGIAAYGVAALSLFGASPDTFTLTLDNRQSVEIMGYGIVVGDLSRFHSARRRWPKAAADDGKFEIVVLKRHLALSAVVPIDRFVADWFQCETIEIHSAREHPVMLDGETVAPQRRLTAVCDRHALTVCVPPEQLLRPWKTPLSVLRGT